jgi:hypothetical protein
LLALVPPLEPPLPPDDPQAAPSATTPVTSTAVPNLFAVCMRSSPCVEFVIDRIMERHGPHAGLWVVALW